MSLKTKLIEMGNCMSWLRGKRRKNARNVTIAIFGIDNAGKTVTVKGLQGEPLDDVAPTIGFQGAEFNFGRHNVNIYDLGGGKGIRDIWSQYYPQVHGLIYVIDSSALNRIQETKEALNNVLSDKRISGKPVLLLANKQDVDGAIDELDLCDQLSLEKTVNQYKTPCRVEMCSATMGKGRKLDKAIKVGFKWLLATIDHNWQELSQRVDQDIEIQRKKEAEERELRKERVRKIREEREKLEGKEEGEEGDDVPISGDPFKPLDLAELTAKEERLKQEKAERKKKVAEEKPPSPSDHPLSNTSTVSVRTAWDSPGKEIAQNSEKNNDESANRTIEETEVKENVEKDRSEMFLVDKSSRKSDDEIVKPATRHLKPLDGDESPPPPEEKKKKKKKKRVKANQTAPVDHGDDVTEAPPPSTWLASSTHEGVPEAPPRGKLAPIAAPRRLEPLQQNGDAQNKSSLTENWNMDLPQLASESPNVDDDDIVT